MNILLIGYIRKMFAATLPIRKEKQAAYIPGILVSFTNKSIVITIPTNSITVLIPTGVV